MATINFPYVLGFSDYHEIPNYANFMSKVVGRRVRCAEINTEVARGKNVDEFYLGVFYLGSRPPTERIVEAIVASRIEVVKELGYYPAKIC